VKKVRHEEWTIDIIRGDTNVGRILEKFRPGFREEVAQIIAAPTPQDIYGSIVSSQFDADRLDYVRRDRVMSGVYHGVFDCSWLLANLEVDDVPLARDDEPVGTVPAFVLSRKAFQAAEAYVLGLFHLYFTVYFHKTTRGAEKMLTALLLRLDELLRDGKSPDCGLRGDHPILRFIKDGTLDQYLRLDDFVIWASFEEMAGAKDPIVNELATRLRERKLYKAIDVSALLEHRGGAAATARFKAKLAEARRAGAFGPIDLLEDSATRNPYQRHGFETPESLSKVLIRLSDGTGCEDLRDCSNVVEALEEITIFRVYVRDDEAREKAMKLMEGV
jgi:HD superfamily phosphohydrolase